MYSIVHLETGAEVAHGNLPLNPAPIGKPRGRVATFRNDGEEAVGYKCVPRETVAKPSPYHIKGTEIITFDGTKVTVDPGWQLPDIETLKTRRIAEIKDKAQDLITGAYPEWQQRNMLAASSQLHDIRLSGQEWTPEHQAQADALKAAWAWVSAVRVHSNALESEISALTTAEAVAAWQDHDW